MGLTEQPPMCSERVFHRMGFSGSWDRCSRRATIGAFCSQHHPVNVAERRAESTARYDRESEARSTVRRRRSAEETACKDLPTDWLEKGGLQRLVAALKGWRDNGTNSYTLAKKIEELLP